MDHLNTIGFSFPLADKKTESQANDILKVTSFPCVKVKAQIQVSRFQSLCYIMVEGFLALDKPWTHLMKQKAWASAKPTDKFSNLSSVDKTKGQHVW